ncbi:hypothetical protein D9Q98_010450 [Chlorella vulgaris]|uniref:Uncharacterized protein n=1 Tax=Chlorella vulgaris TaxID=3077 RepID=A0A9D4YZ08_CHLVU|nr:hypothetical protein D9Q98_010450 [Chlorella vulgaris]
MQGKTQRTPDQDPFQKDAQRTQLRRQVPPLLEEPDASEHAGLQPTLQDDAGMQPPKQGQIPQHGEAQQTGIPASDAQQGARTVVDADYIISEGQETPGRRMREEPTGSTRQSEALLAILQSGELIEEVIAKHRQDIDATTLQLLARRMEAAKQVEKQPEVLEGLQLLYRRLKAEVERQEAAPELRLLDELMFILDPLEGGPESFQAAMEERQRRATAHLRSAFTGGVPGGLAGSADVLSLAAQLSGSGGSQLADQLVQDPVSPTAFVDTATELLQRAQEQQSQLEAYLSALTLQDGTVAESQEMPYSVTEAQQLLENRQAAAALVQDCLQLARTVIQQL